MSHEEEGIGTAHKQILLFVEISKNQGVVNNDFGDVVVVFVNVDDILFREPLLMQLILPFPDGIYDLLCNKSDIVDVLLDLFGETNLVFKFPQKDLSHQYQMINSVILTSFVADAYCLLLNSRYLFRFFKKGIFEQCFQSEIAIAVLNSIL